ncbi:MAG: hypothetical protein RJA49_2771 [Actinomycetota bacterium]
MTVTLHAGTDTRRALELLGPESVDLVTCSPPFLALRKYGTESDAEIGQEGTPADFLATLLYLTDMWGEMLTPHGSIAIELGDSFASSGGTSGSRSVSAGGNDLAPRPKRGGGIGWPMAKSLCLLPTLYPASLAYGRNLLTGEPCTQWRVRNLIVWARPNPTVGALGDKARSATSYITVATRSAKRWHDLDAVRTQAQGRPDCGTNGPKAASVGRMTARVDSNGGAPPLDYWTDGEDVGHELWEMTTQGSSIPHYAMWPPKLADRIVRLMCPSEVCRQCGEPRRRVTAKTPEYAATRAVVGDFKAGWTDCGHGDYRPGIVLDPFAGAGTTLAVADLAGRDAIGIELNANAHDLYVARRAECARALYRAPTVNGSQLDLFAAEEAS